MKDDALRAQIASQQSTFELLFRTARRVNEYALSSLYDKTGVPLRASHTAVFPHLSVEGVRASEIAKKLGISKQAVSKRIDEMVGFGAVERVPDPTDGRATLVRFNSSSVLDGLKHLNALEDNFADAVGHVEMDDLAKTLGLLLRHLDQLTS